MNVIVISKLRLPHPYEKDDLEATFTIPVDEVYPLEEFREWFCKEYNTDNKDIKDIYYEPANIAV